MGVDHGRRQREGSLSGWGLRVTTDLEETRVGEPVVPPDELRLRRFDKRIEEWLGYLRSEANDRSPEVLSAMAAKVTGLGAYLEKMADQARVRREAQETYSGPDLETDPKGDRADEDQGT